MKLIVAGSTGFMGTEVIRQAIANPAITSLIALSRRPTPVPANAGPDVAKLKSVVCEDFENYSEAVKRELAGADACIWTIALTPSQSMKATLEETRKICLDYLVTGLETISKVPRPDGKALRFIYMSGAKVARDQSKRPWVLADYSLLRVSFPYIPYIMVTDLLILKGECENRVFAHARASNGAMEVCVAKPGFIGVPPGRIGPVMSALGAVARAVLSVPAVDVSEAAASMLYQAINGIEQDTLSNEDMIRVGKEALAAQQK
jgi:hypothetical protein